MILNETLIFQMEANDFKQYCFRKIKLITKEEIEIAGKKGKEFNGFISGLTLASNSPNLPVNILFIDENISQKIDIDICNNLAIRINIFTIEQIEIIND